MTISYKKTNRNTFDVLIDGRKRGQIIRKRGGAFKVRLNGLYDLTVLSVMSRDAIEMNLDWVCSDDVRTPADFRVGLDTTRTRYQTL